MFSSYVIGVILQLQADCHRNFARVWKI